MNDELIAIVVGLVLFLVCDFLLFELEHRRIERQHKRHKEEVEELFQRYLGAD